MRIVKKNCRLPLWLCYLNDEIIDDYTNKINYNVIAPKKSKFCSIICQQDNVSNTRSEIVNKLSKYKRVDCGGKFLNNIGYVVPRGINCSGKIEHNNNYKFVIAFENKDYPGYVTEKICDAYKSKCVPIYWGHRDVIKDFNPSTFINANNFANLDELVEYIIKVDNDDKLYASFFKEPILTSYWIDIIINKNNDYFKELAQNIVINNTYYSDCKIDEFLSKFIFKGYKNGFFINIGANDGLTIDNTFYFEKKFNWTGINIEPLIEPFNKLLINRPNCINLNLAINNTDGESEFIYNTGYTEMLSGLKTTYDPKHKKRLDNEVHNYGGTSIIKIVKTKTIKTILKELNVTHVNYISIDVEGGEKNVIESIDFNTTFIDVISFEDNYKDTTEKIIKLMQDQILCYNQ